MSHYSLCNEDNGIFSKIIHDFESTKNGFQKNVISEGKIEKFRNVLMRKRDWFL